MTRLKLIRILGEWTIKSLTSYINAKGKTPKIHRQQLIWAERSPAKVKEAGGYILSSKQIEIISGVLNCDPDKLLEAVGREDIIIKKNKGNL